METHTPTPMRQFVDQPSPHKHSWLPEQFWHLFYFAAPLLLIPCLYLSGSWVVERYYSTASAPAVSPINEESADNLVARYVDTLGGNEAVKQLDQLNFFGAVFSDEDHFTFDGSSSRSRGYAVRLYDSDTAVVALDLQGASGEPLSFQSSNSSEALITALNSVFSDFDNPAIRYLLEGNGRVLQVERQKVGRVHLICLTLETGPTTSAKLYFDDYTMDLVAQENHRDGQTVASYRYSNHKSVRGVRLPHTVDAQIAGMPSLQVHYSTLKAPPLSAGSLVGKALLLGSNR